MDEYDIDDLQKQRGGSQQYPGVPTNMLPNEILKSNRAAEGAQNSQDFDDFDSDEDYDQHGGGQYPHHPAIGQMAMGLIQPPQIYKTSHFLQDDQGPGGDHVKDEYA